VINDRQITVKISREILPRLTGLFPNFSNEIKGWVRTQVSTKSGGSLERMVEVKGVDMVMA
jgi:hypothetical protein